MRKRLVFIIILLCNFFFVYGINYANKVMQENDFLIYLNEEDRPIVEENEIENNHLNDKEFNGETIEKIGEKIEKVFAKTDLEGMGEYVSRASVTKGVNPYLVGAIILESTNCKNECTVLFKQCHNVFEKKGKPGCFGGTYQEYENVNDGINALALDISYKYSDVEMQLPYKIFSSFGKNETWAYKVNKYMEMLIRG